ncbi:hypothetical protein N9E48_10055 [Paracoccaceae bacterium]|nr:hypothetical protein [Paracoccaceae bacterium]
MSSTKKVEAQKSASAFSIKNDLYQAEHFISGIFNNRKIKKILFVHPPDVEYDSFNFEIGQLGGLYNFPPYGLGVLAQK